MPEESEVAAELIENVQKDKYLTFQIDNETYGIDIEAVVEIVSMQPITSVPDAPGYVRGIINLRGQIIPIVDLRLRLKKEFIPYHERTCLIIINFDDCVVSMAVDSVAEVLEIPEAAIVPPPQLRAAKHSCLKGIGKTGEHGEKATLLLDYRKLFSADIAETAADIAAPPEKADAEMQDVPEAEKEADVPDKPQQLKPGQVMGDAEAMALAESYMRAFADMQAEEAKAKTAAADEAEAQAEAKAKAQAEAIMKEFAESRNDPEAEAKAEADAKDLAESYLKAFADFQAGEAKDRSC